MKYSSLVNYLKKFKYFRLIYYKFLRFKEYKNFYNLNLNENSLVLDFGANIGEITQCLLDLYNCKIYCYEPNNYAFQILKNRFKENKKVIIFNKAVGKDDGKDYLYYHDLHDENPVKYSTGSSLLREKENVNSDNCKLTEIISIDNILNQFKNIDLIKIDIEGYEYEILPNIIKNKNKIKKVICELHGSPEKQKLKFLNNSYLETIKKLNEIDPNKDWFLQHY